MEKKKKAKSFINAIKSNGRKIYYINNVGNIEAQEEKIFCKENLLTHMVKNKSQLVDIEIVITRRDSGITSGLISLDSFIYIYCDHITNNEKPWICIMCIEKTYRRDTRDYTTRIYCLGFIRAQDITVICGQKMHPFKDLSIQGVKPEMPFHMLCINKLQDSIVEIDSVIFEQSTIMDTVEVEIVPKREVSTLYVFIMHWSTPDDTQIYDMINLEDECTERLEILWRMRENKVAFKEEIRIRMTDIENWYKDMRTIHSLLLVMCWDEEWKTWYIDSEREYVEIICGCMLDVDDLIINRNYNRLNGDIMITEKCRDISQIAFRFAQIHIDRISIYMKKWIKSRKISTEMPKTLVRFMEKIFIVLDRLKNGH